MIYLNGTPLNVTIFPDKTSQVWQLPSNLLRINHAFIDWKFSSEAELIHLAQLQALLKSYLIESTLTIRYLPYGRQDKETDNAATFALRPFAHLLNSLAFSKIVIVDPHSHIATDLIKNSEAVYPVAELLKIIDDIKPTTFCYPDKGALSKYAELPVYRSFRYIYGEKVRDQTTGNILSYQVVGNAKDQRVLIVDDICDGGMTFKLLAKDLLTAGAIEVNLFVTHGLFTKGLKTLKESGINRIFSQDGEATENNNQITYRRL